MTLRASCWPVAVPSIATPLKTLFSRPVPFRPAPSAYSSASDGVARVCMHLPTGDGDRNGRESPVEPSGAALLKSGRSVRTGPDGTGPGRPLVRGVCRAGREHSSRTMRAAVVSLEDSKGHCTLAKLTVGTRGRAGVGRSRRGAIDVRAHRANQCADETAGCHVHTVVQIHRAAAAAAAADPSSAVQCSVLGVSWPVFQPAEATSGRRVSCKTLKTTYVYSRFVLSRGGEPPITRVSPISVCALHS